MPLEGNGVAACQPLGHMGQHFFGTAHNTVIVGIGLVKFKLGKFWVVFETYTFVAEVAPDFIDAIKATDDQPLEV